MLRRGLRQTFSTPALFLSMNWEDREGNFLYHEESRGQGSSTDLTDLRHEAPDAMEAFPLPRLLVSSSVAKPLLMPMTLGSFTGIQTGKQIVGKFGEVYVLDWGLAKVMGSPRLSSPELLKMKTSKTQVSLRRQALRNPHVHVLSRP